MALVAFGLLMSRCSFAAAATTGTPLWGMASHDSQHTGQTAYKGTRHAMAVEAIVNITSASTPVVASDSSFYLIPSFSSSVLHYSIDGSLQRNISIAPDSFSNDATLALSPDGQYLLAFPDQTAIVAVYTANATIAWRKELTYPQLHPTFSNDGATLYCGYSGINALDVATGATVWETEKLYFRVESIVVMGTDYILLSSTGGSASFLYGLDAATGKQLYYNVMAKDLFGETNTFLVADEASGTVIARVPDITDTYLYWYNAASGQKLRQSVDLHAGNGLVYSSTLGAVIVQSDNGTITAFSSATGSIQWQLSEWWGNGQLWDASPMSITANGILYAAVTLKEGDVHNSYVAAVDANAGKKLWQTQLPFLGGPNTSPLLPIPTDTGRVIATTYYDLWTIVNGQVYILH